MKNKIAVTLLGAVIVVALVFIFCSSSDGSKIALPDSGIGSAGTTENADEGTISIENGQTVDSTDDADENLAGENAKEDASRASPDVTTSELTPEEDSTGMFPYSISGTNLTVQNISGYSGIFLEDGSDSSVSGIAAAVVKNTGKTDIEYAEITVKQADRTLVFQMSGLSAGNIVVVQEASKQAYESGEYQSCTGQVAEVDAFEWSEDKIKVTQKPDGSLTVTNLTDSDIPCVRVFYKFYMSEEKVYVGGITYNAKIINLKAEESQTVTPSHYSAGDSKVIMVRTYDTEN